MKSFAWIYQSLNIDGRKQHVQTKNSVLHIAFYSGYKFICSRCVCRYSVHGQMLSSNQFNGDAPCHGPTNKFNIELSFQNSLNSLWVTIQKDGKYTWMYIEHILQQLSRYQRTIFVSMILSFKAIIWFKLWWKNYTLPPYIFRYNPFSFDRLHAESFGCIASALHYPTH